MRRFRLFGFVLSLILSTGLSSTARAAWGDLYCDIVNGDTAGLEKAVNLYNSDDPDNRACKEAIRFFGPQTIAIPNGLTIHNSPAGGSVHGVAIRRCVSSGPNAEPGCSGMSDTSVILDASGFTGDCPIKVYSGANIDFIKFKVIAANTDKVFCTGAGEPIPMEDTENPYAWIHQVTIEPKGGVPPVHEEPQCYLTATPVADGFRIDWEAEHATVADLRQNFLTISNQLSGSKEIHPTSETKFTLMAVGLGGTCETSVTVTPEVHEVPPTCDLTVVQAELGYNLNWTTKHATSASVSSNVQIFSNQVNNTGVPIHVEPSVTTTYRLSATGPGGSCEDHVTLEPNNLPDDSPQTTPPATNDEVGGDEVESDDPPAIGPAVKDTDGDSIPDTGDNCPTVANTGQVDTDADGIGDACDAPMPVLDDTDGDGTVDAVDSTPEGSESPQIAAVGPGCQLSSIGTDSASNALQWFFMAIFLAFPMAVRVK